MSIWNRYDKVQTILTGGTAKVFVAVDTITGYPVAIKELDARMFKNDFMRAKFREEANRYLYLDHPGIVKLEDFIDTGDTQYLVMEYLSGSNLSEYLKKMTGPMPFQNATLIIEKVADALHFAHENGFLHLDIKPSNVMVTESMEVKLIDFGIAHQINGPDVGLSIGTPAYMAPEQIERKSLGRATDVFALGVTLYELLTGRVPFSFAETREDLFSLIIKQPIPTLQAFYDLDRSQEETMNQILQRATAKNPEQRFPSCAAFMDALKVFQDV